jgi:DNA-binding response OmpR family regulator
VVQVSGQPVELTAKEFAIMEFFMLHPRQVLSREQVLENVWDYAFDGGRNLIEVYMGRLRKKLTDAGIEDPFVTLRGAGYRLDPA